MKIRAIPWLLAVAGLATWLVVSRFAAWLSVAALLIMLVTAWLVVTGYRDPLTRPQRIVLAVVLLPFLVLLWQGGWWLVPADLAWLALELLEGLRRPASPAG